MPTIFLCEADRASHRMASWVLGEKKVRNMNDTELGEIQGISQQAMSRKLREESFSFKDFVYFARAFHMDYDTFQYIVGGTHAKQ